VAPSSASWCTIVQKTPKVIRKTSEVAMPIPVRPSAGSPAQPWMKVSASTRFSPTEPIVTSSSACGRCMPTVYWRSTWNHRHGSRPGASATISGRASASTPASWPSQRNAQPSPISTAPPRMPATVAIRKLDRTTARISRSADSPRLPAALTAVAI
jgi:hypothetical protein